MKGNGFLKGPLRKVVGHRSRAGLGRKRFVILELECGHEDERQAHIVLPTCCRCGECAKEDKVMNLGGAEPLS